MPPTQPTFSESWYRVSGMTPRLLAAVKVHRQHFRGRRWYVLQNPANHQFFRLSEAAYHFVAMFDGRRTVGQVWRVCMERFGDAAPTQGETITLLGQLYTSNLLQGDLSPDADELFGRYQSRIRREVKGFLSNFLFVRIPLLDPDRFLDRWVGLIGRVFTWGGLLFWAAIVGAGFWSLSGHVSDLADRASGVLSPNNLPWLYVAIVIVKIFHELGHAFACKRFGRQSGTGGEVHRMGVVFLVFTPLPFVDASSAWALSNKWRRMVVGASGVLVEIAIASIAAMLWVRTAEGTVVNSIAYNLIFIAGASTLLFNGNPFLRYDAYYILLDAIEVPNLDSRSRSYFCYLVKRYGWGVREAHDPSHTRGEKGWLAFYAVASTICRIVVFSAIILFVAGKFFMIGVMLALAAVTVWVFAPAGRMVSYLATSQELDRARGRAVFTSLAVVFLLLVSVGLIRAPDRCRIDGVVEPLEFEAVHMKTAGFVKNFLRSGARTDPDGPPLIEASSPELTTRGDQLLAELRKLQVSRQLAKTQAAAEAQIVEEKIVALEEQIERNRQDLRGLTQKATLSGTWVAHDIDRFRGRYLPRGERIGLVVDLDKLRIRAVAGQEVAAKLIKDAEPVHAIRVKGRPGIEFMGRIETIIPAGHDRLPSAALGYSAGGSTQIDIKDPSGLRAAEPFFEILVIPSLREDAVIRPGQTVVLRFETSPKPLFVKAWLALLQLFQRRFQV